MKRLRILLIAAALMTAGSALATAQPLDRDGRGGNGDRDGYRDRDQRFDRYRDRDGRGRFDRDDRRFFRDRDDHRFFRDRDDRRFFDRDDHRYFIGERRWFNGYYWNWDGQRWCRRDGRAVFYFSF